MIYINFHNKQICDNAQTMLHHTMIHSIYSIRQNLPSARCGSIRVRICHSVVKHSQQMFSISARACATLYNLINTRDKPTEHINLAVQLLDTYFLPLNMPSTRELRRARWQTQRRRQRRRRRCISICGRTLYRVVGFRNYRSIQIERERVCG